jgi:hypothetical protein
LIHSEYSFHAASFTHFIGRGQEVIYAGHIERHLPGQQVYCYKAEMASSYPDLPYDIGIASAHYLIVDHGHFKRGIYTVEIVNHRPVPINTFHFYSTTLGNFNCSYGYLSKSIDGIDPLGTVVIQDSLIHTIYGLPELSFCFYVGIPNDSLDADYSDNYLCPVIEMTSSVSDSGTDPGIVLWPNPAADMLHIAMREVRPGMRLYLTAVDGKEHYTVALDASGGRVDISHLSPGLFHYAIGTHDRIIAQGKVMIVH